jgi:DNA-directed RNA polymerase specialized sigma24 family protein
MSGGGPASGTTRSVMREIDQELGRLTKWERVAATERELLLSARAALAGGREARRPRVSQAEVAAYLAQHPGSWPADIADALQVPATNVSSHLDRGRRTRYERRDDGWHLRSRVGSDN